MTDILGKRTFKAHSRRAKAEAKPKIVIDVCRFVFDLFRSVLTTLKTQVLLMIDGSKVLVSAVRMVGGDESFSLTYHHCDVLLHASVLPSVNT